MPFLQKLNLAKIKKNYLTASLFVILFSAIGVYLLTGSKASGPSITITADKGTLANGASIQSNISASDGKYVVLNAGSGGTVANSNFVQRSGTSLTLNGSPYRFVGMNVYNANSIYGAMSTNCGPTMSTLNSNPAGDALDKNLALMNSSGTAAQVMRSWFFESLSTDKNGNINWTPFDNTLAIAKTHGIKVIATLDDQWTQCVKSGYKYITWYQSGYKNPDGDGPLSYRSFVQQVVTRYANNPTILMWQFMNEAQAQNVGGTCSEANAAAALRSWSDDIGGLIKSIDPNHLTNTGTGGLGGGCGLQGTDYKTVNASPYTDLCEYHDYNYQTTAMPSPLIADLDYCGKQGLNKPLMVGETGMTLSDTGVGSYQTRVNLFNNKFQSEYNYSDSSGGTGVVGETVWAWDGNLPNNSNYSIYTIDSSGTLDPTIGMMASYIKQGY